MIFNKLKAQFYFKYGNLEILIAHVQLRSYIHTREPTLSSTKTENVKKKVFLTSKCCRKKVFSAAWSVLT